MALRGIDFVPRPSYHQLVLYLKPISLAHANEFVAKHHRHHKPSQGHKFSVAVSDGKKTVGVAIVGRPVGRGSDDGWTLEVTRVCTDGTPNACSILYGAAARAAKSMGYLKIQTYILAEEDGASLRAAGFLKAADTRGGDWNSWQFLNRRTDQPQGPKQRYERILRKSPGS